MEWQKQFIVNSNHKFPIFAEVDILVCGGGAAGVAAGVTAARQGNNVLLVEKYGFLGGAAVAGLSGTICGMYLASDDNPKPEQIIFGFTDEFVKLLREKDGATVPQKYGKTWTITHDPLVWSEVADNIIEEAGAKILYHTDIIGVVKDDLDFKGVIINTKAGMAAIHASAIIDATGDADIIYRSGLDYSMGDRGKIQNPSMIFRLGDVDVPKFLNFWGDNTILPAKAINLIQKLDDTGEFDLPRKKIWIFDTPRPNELLVNATRIVGTDGRDLNVTDVYDHTEAEISGRRQVREYFNFLQRHVPGCENSYISNTGVEVGVRQTRSILGVDRLTNEDVISHRKRSDSIARSPWPIELHYGEKPQVQWIMEDYYDVPYGALVPEVGENIIVAGRNLAAEHEALASARVTAQCFQYGEAAGTAAGLAIKSGYSFRELDGVEIRKLML